MKQALLIFLILVVIVAITFIVLIFDVGRHTPIPADQSPVIDNSITVDQPQAKTVVKSPISISGKARGTWYFEGSFPIKLIDSKGVVIATGIAKANGDWMTVDFVPFTSTLSYTVATTTEATIVFSKDNPSGDPARDYSISQSITLTP